MFRLFGSRSPKLKTLKTTNGQRRAIGPQTICCGPITQLIQGIKKNRRVRTQGRDGSLWAPRAQVRSPVPPKALVIHCRRRADNGAIHEIVAEAVAPISIVAIASAWPLSGVILERAWFDFDAWRQDQRGGQQSSYSASIPAKTGCSER